MKIRIPHLRRGSWRWIAWFSGIAMLALVGSIPLRLALEQSAVRSIGLTARQVGGTIWSGRIGELKLRSQPLGTFDVRLDPLALLLGRISMQAVRLDSLDGPLSGRLVFGARRGVVDASGRIAAGDIFAPMPVKALSLSNVTIMFRDGKCIEASGRVSPVVNAPVAGVEFGPDLSGALECDGERARVTMASPSGAERVEFYVQASGDYRGWMSVSNAPADINGALSLFGFKPSPEGMALTIDGRL